MTSKNGPLSPLPRGATALVTGAGGFTAPHLIRLLLDQGLRVVGVIRPTSARPPALGAVELVEVDLRRRAEVARLISQVRPAAIFHLAGKTRGESLRELLEINVEATDHLLAAASALSTLPRVFLAGSAAEYGRAPTAELPIRESMLPQPVTAYGVSKLAQTTLGLARHADGLPVYVGRLFNCVGPGEPPTTVCSAIARQVAAIALKQQEAVVHTGSLAAERDFLDIRDVVAAYWTIINYGRPGTIYNVCSGIPVPIASLPTLLLQVAGVEAELRSPVVHSGPADVLRSYGTADRLRTDTDWKPLRALSTSLADLFNDWRRRLLVPESGREAA
jgi:GDP-4-dehydro-6-deoxy-D-mannose reductase